MSPATKRITLIHATPVAVEPVVQAFRELWPEAMAFNLLEDSLAPDLERAGRLDGAMVDRFRRLAAYARDTGADAVLFTCSAFGEAIEAAAHELAPLPVLKPNQAMFEEALAGASRIGMVATFAPSVPSMEREFADMAAALGSDAMIRTVCVPEAMAALRSGDGAAHDRMVAEAAAGLGDVEAILLAQFSTARARDAVAARTGRPVLTSTGSAVRKVRGLLEGGRRAEASPNR